MNIKPLDTSSTLPNFLTQLISFKLLTSLRDDGPDAAVLDPILVDDVVDIDESSQLK